MVDDELDKLLSKRAAPPQAREGLAADIVQRVMEDETSSSVTIFDAVAAFFRQNMIIPQPVFAMAMMLVIGLWLGVQYDAQQIFSSYGAEEVAQSLIIDENMNIEEWL